jgi:surfactin synthase thioesterase subunit/glycosyltransferase involved in cell wall biosynthesis
MQMLAERGHSCRVVARAERFGPEYHERFLSELTARGVSPTRIVDGVVVFTLDGVDVHTATNLPNLRAYFATQIAEFDPDVIITSTDDAAQLLLELALRAERARVVYLVRATIAVPFGPDAAFASPAKTDVLREVDGIVGVSHYVADYVRQWSGIEAIHVPISLQDPGPYPDLGRFDNEFITMVNPCAVKGIAIFIELAETFPDLQFAAVPTWGTSADDLAALRRHKNIHVLPPVDDIDEILQRTRVMLVPSVWAEARSRMVLESMLRGVPVLAANVGGLPEAMMGVDYLLPVKPVIQYHSRVDKQMVPVAEVPVQDIRPWVDALRKVTSDRGHWTQLARRSREAAHGYVNSISVEPFERFLESVLAKPRTAKAKPAPVPVPIVPKASTLDALSPEKRKLLALRLRKKTGDSRPVAASIWFPFMESGEDVQLRLFCFPYAGAGAAAYRSWIDQLGPGVAVSPARLPGRETRMAESPFTDMGHLVAALHNAIVPFLDTPFAFFGHSMGAVIAFELARALRRHNEREPVCVIASGARAPQFRLGHVPPPEPSEEEFIHELRMRDGTPQEVLNNDELLRFVLPALRADAALFRNYIYIPAPPLDTAMMAYGGVDDHNVTDRHLKPWGEQTNGSFLCRTFPGGHFFIQSPEFVAALRSDLASVVKTATAEPPDPKAGSEK